MATKIVNKGTGAGGAKTNKNGLPFEKKTDSEKRLLANGYTKIVFGKPKSDYYLQKKFDDKRVMFFKQGGLKSYIKYKFNYNLFRHPDEAYIIKYKTGEIEIYIIEKKVQNVEGSVIDKLLSVIGIKEEYILSFENKIKVNYSLCINSYLKKKINSEKKYTHWNTIFQKNNIPIFYGDDDTYFDSLDKWLGLNNEIDEITDALNKSLVIQDDN